MTPIRVAIVDDSSFVRKALRRVLEGDPRIEVVGAAASGEELLTWIDQWRPDVVTLDLSMPGMGGLRTLDHLHGRPLAVIVLSTHSRQGAPLTIEALHRGAVDFIDKQRFSLVDFGALREVLTAKILEATDAAREAVGPATPRPAASGDGAGRAPAVAPAPPYDVLLVGASAGGPPAIQRLLEDLGGPPPLPVVVVQHMPRGFTSAFAERLNSHLPMAVREAADAETLLPGTVYIAPAGLHLSLERTRGGLVASLHAEPASLSHRPSVDVLFTSASRLARLKTVAVLLTGMGKDGARGMANLAAVGACTLIQDETTSVAWGMPRAALALDAARESLPLPALGGRLRDLMGLAALG